MINNTFENNHAIYGGGGIYFMNKLLKESPYQSNTFSHNKALFANDFYTFPLKVRFQDDKKYKSWVSKSSYAITIIPGFTQINLNFSVIDYYNQTIFLNRFYSTFKIFLFYLSSSTLQLKNLQLEDLNQGMVTITSIPYSLIQNGILN